MSIMSDLDDSAPTSLLVPLPALTSPSPAVSSAAAISSPPLPPPALQPASLAVPARPTPPPRLQVRDRVPAASAAPTTPPEPAAPTASTRTEQRRPTAKILIDSAQSRDEFEAAVGKVTKANSSGSLRPEVLDSIIGTSRTLIISFSLRVQC